MERLLNPPTKEPSQKKKEVISQEPDDEPGQRDVAILIALKEEFRVFRKCAKTKLEPVRDAMGRYNYLFERNGYRCVATFMGTMGPADSALAAERLMEQWRPRTVVMLGIAAGLHDDLKLGDVAVARQIDSYMDSTKARDAEGGFRFEHAGEVYRATEAVVQGVLNLEFASYEHHEAWVDASEEDLLTRVGQERRDALLAKGLVREEVAAEAVHLASGPIVVASSEFAGWLKGRDRKIKALEMEAAGLMKAALERVESTRTLVLRGISDRGDETKSELDAIGGGGLRAWAMFPTRD